MALSRRELMLCGAGGLVCAGFSTGVVAKVPAPLSTAGGPPLTSKADYIEWMQKSRGETANFLGQRWDRLEQLIAHKDVWDDRNKRAYLLTPRERFVTKANINRAYEWHYLDIGYGVTITGPHTVARMTNSIDVRQGDKVLEIGTGSGYQSAYLAYLTDQVYSIEIIKPLAVRTRGIYDGLIADGYTEYKHISTHTGDGYYGLKEEAPFDRIIVTCGIDHIPPPLLQQLQPNGIMVIPVGPPGAQHVLKVTKQAADGSFTVARSDIYQGGTLSFVPLTKLGESGIVGTHNGN
ncbi:protein-L-isoaspartate O-methyltransferase [Mesorhizobium qingshengii]|uniref:Protein-L-isoaspartate O-methyltransferase n=1 Tax=Mesorhizobium qingshengii TaxID=1165689 RepID=A0ABT4R462_9HYPH|nr:protein-L-isoaspartate O-methyltransferase [Mesorhizobium qingshengii]MCZ8548616.1 protein-L-isoaspartate O-methyltransferase [Mesorhizobium qingshengii]